MKLKGNKNPRGFGLFWGTWTADGYKPPLLHKWLKPKDITGNAINGMGESEFRRPVSVYHAPHLSTPFRAVNISFLAKNGVSRVGRTGFQLRKKWSALKLSDVADERIQHSPDEWSRRIKEKVLELGAGAVGITRMNNDWVYKGYDVPEKWIIMIGTPMNYEELAKAPEQESNFEVMRVYNKGHMIAFDLANWLRDQGWAARGHGSFDWSPVTMIPAAIEAGIGELGKHGSMIHKEMGSSFRLAYVLTDLPLVVDHAEPFGADEFCINCQVCTKGCPPDAILPEKVNVRGTNRYYVDFDKCVPFFNDTAGCGICIAVCPWSRPGVAETLLPKWQKRLQRKSVSKAER